MLTGDWSGGRSDWMYPDEIYLCGEAKSRREQEIASGTMENIASKIMAHCRQSASLLLF